jgi:CheY-like chemotaxis protein
MANPIVLIVEDDKPTQYVLQQLLQRFDFESQVVGSAEEALKAVSMTQYAAILMDICLPGMDGYDCTRRIRDLDLMNGRHTSIIALTGRVEIADQEQCRRAGMDDYMSKPFEPEDLRRMLLRWVYDAANPNLKVLPRPRTDDLARPSM